LWNWHFPSVVICSMLPLPSATTYRKTSGTFFQNQPVADTVVACTLSSARTEADKKKCDGLFTKQSVF
jgi:hypothetical protein